MSTLFLNTLIFKKQLDAHEKCQSELFQTVKELGASGIEVRREYFFENGLLEDMARCGEQAKKFGLHVFYSVPEKLFVNGKVSDRLETYFREGAVLNAENIKLNIGEPPKLNSETVRIIEDLMQTYPIQLTIENDQTEENGRLNFVSATLEGLCALDSPIGYTFDLGNWLWQGADPVDAAKKVGRFTTIFHLKDVSKKNGPQTELLGEGAIDWVSALSICPTGIPVVIEYPIESLAALRKEITKVRDVLTKQKEGARVMSEVITIGEPMIMFVADTKGELKDVQHFTRYIAGAEVNVSVGVSRLNHSVSLISQVGDDPFGAYIRLFLNKEGIDTGLVSVNNCYPTGFQLKSKTEVEDPEVVYFRKGSAASKLDKIAIDNIDFSGAKILHLTGIFPALSAETFNATLRLIEKARENNLLITFDPNLRPTLWKNEETMKARINQLAGLCDVVLPGFREGKRLTGRTTKEKVADFYLNNGAKTVIIKLGNTGAYCKRLKPDGSVAETVVSAFHVDHVVDTVGAGDGFAVGIVTGLLESLPDAELLERGNAIGAIQVQHISDNEGLPNREHLAAFIKQTALKTVNAKDQSDNALKAI
ncbi:PfkB family carbohydrate kinase [Sporolactobacillus laevolacticus]|uniref:PfkB family carbohydrate kinase n=1 Tax=Sporolactobacillus laevolacticus TaxID=33018 RepID=UPI00338FC894